jgi:hypothetical protein
MRLTAEAVMLPGEDPGVFDDLRADIYAAFIPEGAFEEQLVERAISLLCRLRRVPAFEAVLFRSMQSVSPKKDTRIALGNQRGVGDTDNSAWDGLEFGRTLKELLYSGNG